VAAQIDELAVAPGSDARPQVPRRHAQDAREPREGARILGQGPGICPHRVDGRADGERLAVAVRDHAAVRGHAHHAQVPGLALAEASPAWATLEANARNAEAPVKLPPLVPLTQEHLALLVASGHLNETVVPTNEGPLLLRGRVRKVEEELPPESDDDRTVRRIRQRYLAVIQALNLETMELEEIQ